MKRLDFSKKNLSKKWNRFKTFMKKRYVNFFKEFPLFAFFMCSVLINTLLLRMITVHNGLYFKPLFLDMGMIFIFSSLAFLFQTEKGMKNYIIGFSIFSTILCIVHSAYYTFYDSFASISLLATSTFVVDVGDAVVEQVIRLEDFIYLWQPLFIFYVTYHIRKKKRLKGAREIKISKVDRKFNFFNLLITGVVVTIFSFVCMTPTEWGRFNKLWNRESVVSSFGIFAYQVNDIVQSLEPKLNNLFGHDKALREVREYYENNEVEESSNEYSKIFEGKNVLVIHAESLQTIAIDRKFENQEVTPFINKISKEGIYFSNFYSEVGVGTSSDAEFTFSTSLMPSNSGTVFVNYFDRQYQTIQKLFKNKGYYVFSMHANTGDFWNRAIMHENMGYDDFYSKSAFEIDETIGLGLSDKSFFKQAVPKLEDIIKEQNRPFYGTLITLTNHTPWTDFELMDEFPTTWTVDINGESVVRDYLEGTTLGNYFRSVHYADQALEQLFGELDEAGILDDTVVVIYGDHDARISKKFYNRMYNYDPYTDSLKEQDDEGYVDYNDYRYELDKKVPFIIWTKDKKYKKEIKNVGGMIDALPTLANMFGIGVNQYQMGHDLMSLSEGDNTVVFTDGSYVTDKIYYDGQSGDIYSINGEAVDEMYVKDRSRYADDLMDISNNIITYDLIKELESKNSS